jgi:hypothetical protein
LNANVPLGSITADPSVPALISANAVTEPVVKLAVVGAVTSPTAAFAGATDKRPIPRADTATSAMRLRSVLIDILFLSLSHTRPFLIWLEEVV